MIRHTAAPPDAAATEQAADGLPTWNLRDLYPGPDSSAVEADFAKAEDVARAFAAAYQGRLADLPGGALASAIAEYERIEELLGRLMSYAQLLFAGTPPTLTSAGSTRPSASGLPRSAVSCCSSPSS